MYGSGVKKPANNIGPITKRLRRAPPVKNTSVRFMASSILTMEIIDIPQAVLSALKIDICFNKMIVSKMIEVIKPFTMASAIILRVDQPMLKY